MATVEALPISELEVLGRENRLDSSDQIAINKNEIAANQPKKNILKIIFNVAFPIMIILILILMNTFINMENRSTSILRNLEQSKNFYVEDFINNQIRSVLSKNRFYDIHAYVKDAHFKQKYKILNQAQSYLIQQRPKLNFTQTTEQVQALIKSLRKQDVKVNLYTQKKPAYPRYFLNQQLLRDQFFFLSLNKEPQNRKYLQAEFYRYDKKYNISQYGDELPLCAIMIGKNNKRVIKKMYNSIKNQNYTNFKVIHVDDNSNDGTIEEVQALIKGSPVLSKRVTLVVQPLQMNSLFNRDFSYSLCGENDIILDMDADDWILGKQVFQLVNTIYQQGGNTYNTTEETDTWAVYFNIVKLKKDKVPYHSYGNIPQEIIQKQSYRIGGYNWRTTQLRTFLNKAYQKIDKKDFVDPMSQQFFVERQDTFIQYAIFELSAPKHIKFIDEFVYFYQQYGGKKDIDFLYYAQMSARSLPPYNQLQSLDAQATRNYNFTVPVGIKQKLVKYTKIVKRKYDRTKDQINKLVNKAIAGSEKLPEKGNN